MERLCGLSSQHREAVSRLCSFPSLLRCELRHKFFASLCFQNVLREMVLSLSRSSESITRQTDLCLILDFLSASRKHVPPVQFFDACRPVVALYFGSDLAHLEVLRVLMLRIMSFDFSLNGLIA